MIESKVADNDYPTYSIGVVADLLEVHPRTLRLYEKAGLLFPSRRGGKRFYSRNDVHWLQCLRRLIHEEGVNISGLQKLLQLMLNSGHIFMMGQNQATKNSQVKKL